MVINISCKFEKATYNILFVRAVTVKSLYTLQRHIEAKSILSTGCFGLCKLDRKGRSTLYFPLVIQLCLLIQVEVVQVEKECSAFLSVFYR